MRVRRIKRYGDLRTAGSNIKAPCRRKQTPHAGMGVTRVTSESFALPSKSCSLEHVPKKLLDFFDKDMLQLFEIERVLIDQMVPFDRDAL